MGTSATWADERLLNQRQQSCSISPFFRASVPACLFGGSVQAGARALWEFHQSRRFRRYAFSRRCRSASLSCRRAASYRAGQARARPTPSSTLLSSAKSARFTLLFAISDEGPKRWLLPWLCLPIGGRACRGLVKLGKMGNCRNPAGATLSSHSFNCGGSLTEKHPIRMKIWAGTVCSLSLYSGEPGARAGCAPLGPKGQPR